MDTSAAAAVVEAARPKVNLTLRVLGRRPHDGYHALESLVAFAREPADIVTFEPGAPVEVQVEGVPVLLLSATDSCRDRLAAFYHWKDRQALGAAVAIATNHPLDLEKIRAWSRREGAAEGFEEFLRSLKISVE